VFLAATGDDAFTRFCTAVGRDDLARDDRFATEAARGAHDDELAAALEMLFRTRCAREWEALALAAGVGCVVADGMSFHAFLHRDDQARTLGMTSLTSHPALGGAYWRPAPAIGLSETPCAAGAYCEIGEHTRAILAELGYDEDTIARLKADAVVTWPDEAR
jgi:crotonobetainyl-CoA:carnitine CoA-transferase CaiB-like acyl-CoA transferase